MITEQDLQAAIAECQGQKNPNASTCIKLAAFLIIKEHMYPEKKESDSVDLVGKQRYSYAGQPVNEAEDTIKYDSGTEFSQLIFGKPQNEVWPVIDELMSVIQTINPRLYNGVIRKINA